VAGFEQQITISANISPAERAVNQLTAGLSKVEKLAKGALDGLKKNTRLQFDTRGAEQQLARLQRGISGLSQRVRVQIDESYKRSQDRNSQQGGGVAVVGGGNQGPSPVAAAATAAAAALREQQQALRDLVSGGDQFTQLQEQQAAAATKLAAKTEELAQAQRRLQQNQNGFADKGKTLAQSLRDNTNAVEMRLRALQRYQQELDDTSAAVYRYGAAERRVASELSQAEYQRTGGLDFEQRLANRRKQTQFRGTGGKAAAAGAASAGLFIPGLSEIATGGAAGFAVGGAPGAAIGAVAAGITAATAAAVKGSGEIARYSAEVTKLQIALRGISGSQAEFQQSLAGISRIADRLNIPLADATEQVTQLRAAMSANGFTASDTLRVYESLAAANVALGGDAQRLQGILLATSQVFSKGKVSAEELRGQIGERLAGAFADFAVATGKSTSELDKALEKGEVSLQDFLEFTQYIAKKYNTTADEIAKSQENAGARMAKSWEKFQLAIGPILSDIGSKIQNWATTILNSLTPVINKLQELLGYGDKALNNRLYLVEKKLIPEAESRLQQILNDPFGTGNPQNQMAARVLRQQLAGLKAEAADLRKQLYPPTTPNTKPKPGGSTIDEKDRQKQLEDAARLQAGINTELGRQLQAEYEIRAAGKSTYQQLLLKQALLERLAELQRSTITSSTDDPALKVQQLVTAQKELEAETAKLKQEYADLITELRGVATTAYQALKGLTDSAGAATESPLEAQLRAVQDEITQTELQFAELDKQIQSLAAGGEADAALKPLLDSFQEYQRRLREFQDPKLQKLVASQRLTQGDQQGLEEQQRSLQLQINAYKEGRTQLTGMQELIGRYGADWEKLDATVKGHLVDLARTNEALQGQLEKLQQIRADAEALSGITVTGIQDAIVASVTNGDIRGAFQEMFSQLGDQFLTMGLRPVQEWLTREVSKLLGLTLSEATQAVATNANSAALTAATAATTAATPAVVSATAAVTANTAAVTANTAALAAQAGAGAAGSAASGILGIAGSVFGVASSGFGGGAFGAGFNPLSTTKLFSGGAFASGGSTPTNQPVLVGERGPELFVPGQSGGITNNQNLRSLMASEGSRKEGGSAVYSPTIEATSFGGQDWVTLEQMNAAVQEGMAVAARQGADRGMVKTLDRLRQSPRTRKGLGM
jgi:tape measure domain-containing protein